MKTLNKLFVLAALALPSWGALPNYTTVWNVRTAGDNTNGGCHITGSTGTDFSLQDAAQFSYTDLVAVTTTTITSAAFPFDSTIPGNCFHIASGTGWTVGWYYCVSVTTVTCTVDRAVATMGSTGGTGKLGGALATPLQCSTNMPLSAASTCNVKADGTYSIASMITVDFSGSNVGNAVLAGYTTTPGDGGMVTLQAAAGLAGADNTILRFNSTPAGTVVANFILDCNGQTFTGGLRFQSNFSVGRNLWAKNCSDAGFNWDGFTGVCIRCTTTNTPAAGISGNGNGSFYNNNTNAYCYWCAALGSTVNNKAGFDSFCGGGIYNGIVAHYTGTTSDGVRCTTQEGDQLVINGLSVYDITRDAIRYGEAQGIDYRPLQITNIVASNFGGVAFNQTGSLVLKNSSLFQFNLFCNPGSGACYSTNWTAGPGAVTLSADPFTNGASNDFSLNGTAGGGAAAKALGYPGVLTVGGTGYLDPGALQSQAGAGGAQAVSAYSQ